MSPIEVKAQVKQIIIDVAAEQKIKLPKLRDDLEIVDDLGFTSLSVTLLIARLEDVFGVDPFSDEDFLIDDLRTVGGIGYVYAHLLQSQSA